MTDTTLHDKLLDALKTGENFGENYLDLTERVEQVLSENHKPLPVSGYTPQSDAKVALVNGFKQDEERLLRKLDELFSARVPDAFDALTDSPPTQHVADARWLSIARTHFEQAFMALNRSVFQPQRIKLPEDDGNPPGRQTSPEVAALAGRLMGMSDDAMGDAVEGAGGAERFFADIRKLAASALGQVNE